MKSAIVKRSIVIDGHKTSVSLENEFWDGLHEIADQQKATLSRLVERIDLERRNANLSSAIRVFVYNSAHGKDGHEQASTQDRRTPAVGAMETPFIR